MTEKHQICQFDENKLEELFALVSTDDDRDAYHAPVMYCPKCGLLYFFIKNVRPKGKPFKPGFVFKPGFGIIEVGGTTRPPASGQAVSDRRLGK